MQRQVTNAFGLFGTLSYTFDNGLILQAGARYNDDDRDFAAARPIDTRPGFLGFGGPVGTLRTEVAVGMASEASMLRAVRMGAPLSCTRVGSLACSLRTTRLGRLADRPMPVPGDSGAAS